MEWYLQGIAGLMIAVILWIVLSKEGREYAVIVSIGACCLALFLALRFLEPVLDLIEQLCLLANLESQWLSTLLKTVGIGLVAEIGALICMDAGNTSLGKTIQILSSIAIIWLSIPLINSFIDLLEKILEEI